MFGCVGTKYYEAEQIKIWKGHKVFYCGGDCKCILQLVGKTLGTPRPRWKGNIKKVLKETVLG